PWEMKWMSKESIFRVPFLGWMMRMAGDVAVKRSSVKSRADAYAKTREWIDRGSSVMIFPEGTRSRTGEMLPFRSGAFRLAVETGRPVHPIAVSGTRDAIRKGSMFFGRADVVVRILEPIPASEISDGEGPDEVKRIRDIAREAIEAARSARSQDLAQPLDRNRL
ncbi:MAG: lysophospholipid acyltransferase family protein, partial [Gemmatimonadota bacterium]